jgi:hypothetical protein
LIDAHRHIVTGMPNDWLANGAATVSGFPRSWIYDRARGDRSAAGNRSARRIEAGQMKGQRLYIRAIIPVMSPTGPPPNGDPARTDPARGPLPATPAPAIPRDATIRAVENAVQAGYDAGCTQQHTERSRTRHVETDRLGKQKA